MDCTELTKQIGIKLYILSRIGKDKIAAPQKGSEKILRDGSLTGSRLSLGLGRFPFAFSDALDAQA
jgi:hypothetical protein